jgi:hypothetical protein
MEKVEKIANRGECCLQILCTDYFHLAVKILAEKKGETISGYLGSIVLKHLVEQEGIKSTKLLGYKAKLGRPRKQSVQVAKSLAKIKAKRARPGKERMTGSA